MTIINKNQNKTKWSWYYKILCSVKQSQRFLDSRIPEGLWWAMAYIESLLINRWQIQTLSRTTLWAWASCLTSLSHSFLIGKIPIGSSQVGGYLMRWRRQSTSGVSYKQQMLRGVNCDAWISTAVLMARVHSDQSVSSLHRLLKQMTITQIYSYADEELQQAVTHSHVWPQSYFCWVL